MTERGRAQVHRGADFLTLGPSEVYWHGDALTIRIDERTCPLPSRIQGTIRVHPRALASHTVALDAESQHHWQPIAPHAKVEVHLGAPALRWSGIGYLDSNGGTAPVEDSLRRWDWSRASLGDGTAVIYDVSARNGTETSLALHFDRHAQARPFEPPPPVALPRTGWRIERHTRADNGHAAIVRTIEDTPFYARSELRATLAGQTAIGVHESLDLNRFRAPIVQAMLPFRMPRRGG